jgi:hypothetical protein
VPSIDVLGADLMDGTPIYDIKPYLAYVDSHPDARGGFTDGRKWRRLQVEMPEALTRQLPAAALHVLREVLSLDPRPHYHADDSREYGMPFMGYDVRFTVSAGVARVVDIRIAGQRENLQK